jgi:ATP-dependent exoDNAse (exonuclease V) beta subunit
LSARQLDRHNGSGAQLTAEQMQAVTRRSGPLLLAAGAGSGKTSVLVERFVRAVREDGIAPGQILAITFTDRAAGELRDRVRARFIQLGDREAARELQGAFVVTFHGFCVRLLRTHALQAGLDPDFQILEEGLAASMRSRAFAAALRELLLHRGEPAVDLLAAYGAERVQAMILDVHDELRSRGELEPRLPRIQPRGSIEIAAQQLLGAAARAALELQAFSEQPPGKRVRQGLKALEGAVALLESPSVRIPSPGELAALKLPSGSSALAGPDCEAYRAALESYARICIDTHGAAACELLDCLLASFNDTYTALKQARGVLDFDDLELHARSLLERDPALRASFSERFQLLMVDEFQDSNPRQLAILGALERENLCTVGDELQSIYGFRHADVSLFTERRARLQEQQATITLARNFRAREPLIQTINAVFSKRFSEDYMALIPGRQEQPRAPEDGEALVELLLTDKRSEDQGQPEANSATVSSWRTREAHQLAARIAELIGSGATVAADVVVLLRALGDVSAYEHALAARGIPTIAAVGGFWSHQQVGDLLCYLRALANPLDELSLFSTLASPLVGISSDGLASIADQARAAPSTVWETIAGIAPSLGQRLGDTDQRALERFCADLVGERATAATRPIAELIQRAVSLSGYQEHVLSRTWGERRLANVHKLMRVAQVFESSEGRDLRAFLDHVAQLELAGGRSEPDAPVTEQDLQAVRLMSIHAAKGLEFAVVCLADLGRVPYLRAPDLLVGSGSPKGTARLGVQLVSLDGSESVGALDFDQLRLNRRREEAAEEQRIIYVAMTRARERLLLSGAADFENWPGQTPASPPIGWLAPALVGDLPALLAHKGTSVQLIPGTVATQVRCWLDGAEAEDPGATVCSAPAPPAPAKRIQRAPSRRSPTALTGEPSRGQLTLPGLAATDPPAAHRIYGKRTLSYSSLASYGRCGYRYYLEEVLGIPEARSFSEVEGADRLAGRARGQIVHRLLESVDFSQPLPPSTNAVGEIATELGLDVAAPEREQIASMVAGALKGDLARRLADVSDLRREQPFGFALGASEPLITGVFDVLARESHEHWLIVDYKTDRLTAQTDLAALLERQYSIQRLIYGLAALRGGASEVEVVHWFLERPQEWVTHRFGKSDVGELERQLIGSLQGMRDGGFPVSDTPHRDLCLTCPARRGLCSWEESHTLRRSPDD